MDVQDVAAWMLRRPVEHMYAWLWRRGVVDVWPEQTGATRVCCCGARHRFPITIAV